MSAAPKVEICNLTSLDLPAVIGLVEMLEELPRWPTDFYESLVNPDPPVERIVLVAVSGAGEASTRNVCGFVVASLVSPEAELESIAVARDAQRRGIGRRLLFELIEKLRGRQIERVRLEVRSSNGPAMGLYKSFGFRIVGSRPRYYSDPVDDAILMELDFGEAAVRLF